MQSADCCCMFAYCVGGSCCVETGSTAALLERSSAHAGILGLCTRTVPGFRRQTLTIKCIISYLLTCKLIIMHSCVAQQDICSGSKLWPAKVLRRTVPYEDITASQHKHASIQSYMHMRICWRGASDLNLRGIHSETSFTCESEARTALHGIVSMITHPIES